MIDGFSCERAAGAVAASGLAAHRHVVEAFAHLRAGVGRAVVVRLAEVVGVDDFGGVSASGLARVRKPF